MSLNLTPHGTSDGARTYRAADGRFYIYMNKWLSHPNGTSFRGVPLRCWKATDSTKLDTNGVAREVVSACSLASLRVKLEKYIAAETAKSSGASVTTGLRAKVTT